MKADLYDYALLLVLAGIAVGIVAVIIILANITMAQ